MPKHFRSLNDITVTTPCNADWNSMRGNDQIRFCEHCDLHVSNLSALTRRDAMRLVEKSQGRLCVRYVHTASGEVLTKDSRRLHHIGHKVSRIAAGAFSAAVSLSTATAQTASSGGPEQTATVERLLSAAKEGASISGVVTDPNGAVVPGATITLVNKQTNLAFTYVTKDDGAYTFMLLGPGHYSIEAKASSFVNDEEEVLKLESGANKTKDFTLRIPEIIAEVEIRSEVLVTLGAVAITEPFAPMIKAAYKNDLAALLTLIPVTADANANDPATGVNAISYAIENHNAEMVNVLLSAGATLKTADRRGRTPLMFLDDEATTEFARQLISAGAEVNARDENGETVLMSIAGSCKFEVFKELVAAGARLDVKDKHDNTILMRAVENEDVAIARFLIAAGVSIDARNDDGESALTLAARSGKAAVLKALIDAGATINLAQGDLDDALRAALDNEASTTVRTLLDAGANPNSADSDRKTVLMEAAENSKLGAMKVLIDAGADLNAVDNDGWTALMYCDDVESVRVLLNAGADMNIKNKEGETVLAIATRAEQEEIVKLLKSRGAPE